MSEQYVVQTHFTVPGPPQPKQRARKGKRGRWYTPEATRAYESAVKTQAMISFMKLPEAWPTDRRYLLVVDCHFGDEKRRDIDNVTKAVADALNKIAYADDNQLHKVIAARYLDRERPRTEVTLYATEDKVPSKLPKRRRGVAA